MQEFKAEMLKLSESVAGEAQAAVEARQRTARERNRIACE